MCQLSRDNATRRLILTGYVFLVLANASQLVFRHTPSLSEDLVDGIRGLLFGIAIGSLLVGIWRNGRAAVGG